MNTPENSISPADFATPEQIDRNLERLRKIGDSGRTGNLLADWEAGERERAAKERFERYRLQDEEFDRRQALRLADPETELRELWTAKGVPIERQNELIADATAKAQPGAQVGPFTVPAGNACFDFHASGEDLPLFAQS